MEEKRRPLRYLDSKTTAEIKNILDFLQEPETSQFETLTSQHISGCWFFVNVFP